MKIRFWLYISFQLVLVQFAVAQQDSLLAGAKDTIKHRPIEQSYKLTGKVLSGRAGTYSTRADGTLTANGETFSNSDFTAGCNRFPFNTWISVTNRKNGKSVLVRVNDRVPKRSKSLLELSRVAVKKLGYLKQGYANVKIQKILIVDSLSIINAYKDTAQAPTDGSGIKLASGAPPFRETGHTVTGIASFYSSNLDGTLTATGERYRNNKLTAASNFFKLNTWVQVTNLRNHKTVIVRINDRMHPRMKKKGRVVDLSVSAARELDFIRAGLTKVRVDAIEWQPADSSAEPHPEMEDTTTSVVEKDTLNSRADTVSAEPGPDTIVGTASYLNAGWEGRTTSIGEKFRQKSMMAASNAFPLNAWVKVTRLSTGKSVIVRIVNRISSAAEKKGRVVFLSHEAAGKIGILSAGIVKVKVEKAEPANLN